MLLIKKSEIRYSKLIKCRCSRSKCSVKYCDCFANGRACGSSCECSGCLNLTNTNTVIKKVEDRFCNCSKSGCQKNYCECFQRGDACSSKCGCENCKNTSGSSSDSKFWYCLLAYFSEPLTSWGKLWSIRQDLLSLQSLFYKFFMLEEESFNLTWEF